MNKKTKIKSCNCNEIKSNAKSAVRHQVISLMISEEDNFENDCYKFLLYHKL